MIVCVIVSSNERVPVDVKEALELRVALGVFVGFAVCVKVDNEVCVRDARGDWETVRVLTLVLETVMLPVPVVVRLAVLLLLMLLVVVNDRTGVLEFLADAE